MKLWKNEGTVNVLLNCFYVAYELDDDDFAQKDASEVASKVFRTDDVWQDGLDDHAQIGQLALDVGARRPAERAMELAFVVLFREQSIALLRFRQVDVDDVVHKLLADLDVRDPVVGQVLRVDGHYDHRQHQKGGLGAQPAYLLS